MIAEQLEATKDQVTKQGAEQQALYWEGVSAAEAVSTNPPQRYGTEGMGKKMPVADISSPYGTN